MGSFPVELAGRLADRLSLQRAVETGTHEGGTARHLAHTFPTAVTIELSDQLYQEARASLGDLGNLELIHGESSRALAALDHGSVPTLYWLDAHWSSGETAKAEIESPVLAEIAAISPGHPDDCILIDDARLFSVSSDPDQWPTLVQVFDSLAAHRPDHHVTLLHDLVIAVPGRAKSVVDQWGSETIWEIVDAAEPARQPAAAQPGGLRALAGRIGRALRPG